MNDVWRTDRHRKWIRNEKDQSGCAISGFLNEDGSLVDGEVIIRSIENMHDRGNGLGGGFAAYGIYPDYAEYYALHLMYDDDRSREETEAFITSNLNVADQEAIPTRAIDAVQGRPILWRYFVVPKGEVRRRHFDLSDDDIMAMLVMHINGIIEGAFVFSSGRNMGCFKGVGYPEDIGRFFRLEEYKGWMWTAHGRFPTNTTGWWGGAHPFALLDWSVVHNGEVSSYGINRRYLANFGYNCTMQTDTEVIAYLFDLLVRKHGLPLEMACKAVAPPLWQDIERMPPEERELYRLLRITYGGALLNGPFSIVITHAQGMIGLNDRIKLRPMVAARKGDTLLVASEEAAIRTICAAPDSLWRPDGGEPVIGRLKSADAPKDSQEVAIA
jgi:glutamate synthase domain-containing protein 1